MNKCGKLVTMGHGDNAECGEDYWGELFQCVECQLKDLKCSDAPVVNVAESSSPMLGLSPKQEPEVKKILRDLDDMTIRLHLKLTSIEDRLKAMEDELSQILQIQNKLLEALAEDQDPDEMPATYMDGSPV